MKINKCFLALVFCFVALQLRAAERPKRLFSLLDLLNAEASMPGSNPGLAGTFGESLSDEDREKLRRVLGSGSERQPYTGPAISVDELWRQMAALHIGEHPPLR